METIRNLASRLVETDLIAVEPIGDGRNSRVYKLVDTDHRAYALKAYFRHSSDKRDRLGTEYSSLLWLWEHGIREIPQPLASDREAGCALYEFIDGKEIGAETIADREVDEAVRFLSKLKELSRLPESRDLPPAADACFSVSAIIENIRRRLDRFRSYQAGGDLSFELLEFLDKELIVKLDEIVRWCRYGLKQAGDSFERELSLPERTLSPSDFGFHNALRREGGGLVFLDFEYFGWDDPAKMVADMLLHPAMNLSDTLKRRFVGSILSKFADHPHLAKRIEIVYPLFGLKWCLILLNEFLPEHLLRRQFAKSDGFEIDAIQAEQLSKVRHLLQKVSEDYEHFAYFS